MNEVERAIKKFQQSPSPVILSSAEHKALCTYYGAIRPDDYEHPFMGKVITIREPEFENDGAFELPISTFLPAPEPENHFVAPLADELDRYATEFPPDEDDDYIPDENPFA